VSERTLVCNEMELINVKPQKRMLGIFLRTKQSFPHFVKKSFLFVLQTASNVLYLDMKNLASSAFVVNI